MGRTTELRREIREVFLPLMTTKGFKVDLRHMPQVMTFRKIEADRILICDIQWEKYGRPRFVMNFGSCGANGSELNGAQVAANDVNVWDAPDRGQLAPGRSRTVAGWFRQDKTFLSRLLSGTDLRPASDAVRDLIRLFPEVEGYWLDGTCGPHLRIFPSQIVPSNRVYRDQ
jgi:hypothetical protein